MGPSLNLRVFLYMLSFFILTRFQTYRKAAKKIISVYQVSQMLTFTMFTLPFVLSLCIHFF